MDGTMADVTYDDLVRWKQAIDRWKAENPPEAWMHVREVDGRWEVIERGETPPGFFTGGVQMDFHEPWQEGDRLVARERVWVHSGGVMEPLERPGTGTSGEAPTITDAV